MSTVLGVTGARGTWLVLPNDRTSGRLVCSAWLEPVLTVVTIVLAELGSRSQLTLPALHTAHLLSVTVASLGLQT